MFARLLRLLPVSLMTALAMALALIGATAGLPAQVGPARAAISPGVTSPAVASPAWGSPSDSAQVQQASLAALRGRNGYDLVIGVRRPIQDWSHITRSAELTKHTGSLLGVVVLPRSEAPSRVACRADRYFKQGNYPAIIRAVSGLPGHIELIWDDTDRNLSTSPAALCPPSANFTPAQLCAFRSTLNAHGKSFVPVVYPRDFGPVLRTFARCSDHLLLAFNLLDRTSLTSTLRSLRHYYSGQVEIGLYTRSYRGVPNRHVPAQLASACKLATNGHNGIVRIVRFGATA